MTIPEDLLTAAEALEACKEKLTCLDSPATRATIRQLIDHLDELALSLVAEVE